MSQHRIHFQCAQCGGDKVYNNHERLQHERLVGPKQETSKMMVRGLGTWNCPKCGVGVKVKRSK